jgi:hypothetical protein
MQLSQPMQLSLPNQPSSLLMAAQQIRTFEAPSSSAIKAIKF